MNILEKQKKLIEEFNKCKDWEERYKKIIEMGKALPLIDEKFKTDDFKVKGCQSQVWLHAELNTEKQVILTADSDAVIVKGLVAVLLHVYSGSKPKEILEAPFDFLKDLGFEGNLSPSRANGLYSMLKQIRHYATAFHYLVQQ